jgi:hypothetical protein
MDDQRAQSLLKIPALVIGAIFILVGIFRPAFLWDMGKVRTGREWFGDAGMSGIFIGFGLLFCGAIIATSLKRPK